MIRTFPFTTCTLERIPDRSGDLMASFTLHTGNMLKGSAIRYHNLNAALADICGRAEDIGTHYRTRFGQRALAL